MRVLQIATVVTPDNAYGGPIRVAINQAIALGRLGVDVTFVAGYTGDKRSAVQSLGELKAQLFPVSTMHDRFGFAAYSSPRMRKWLRRRVESFDAVHVHLARDLVTLPAARISLGSEVPTFVQTHGMIAPSKRLTARPIDWALTRPVLNGARRAFYLTEREKSELLTLTEGKISLEHLPNGVPTATGSIAAAPPNNVLFLSRLHPRKRPAEFVRMATALADLSDFTFSVVGPDEGALVEVEHAIATSDNSRVQYEGPLAPTLTLDRMRKSCVFVLPSVNEPFPMAVLEAMSVGLPVVVTESCGLAGVVRESGAGIVVDHSSRSLHDGVRRLLEDHELRAAAGQRALEVSQSRFAMAAIAEKLRAEYHDATDRRSSRSCR